MVDFENSPIGGGVLAEDAGLGKTIETIGLLLHSSNGRCNAIQNNLEVPKALPTLILMPRSLLTQWKNEILRFTGRFTTVMYWGTPKNNTEDGVIYQKDRLVQSSRYFNGDEFNADTLILSTYSTWGTRYGVNAQDKYANNCIIETSELSMDRKQTRSYFNENWKKFEPLNQAEIQLNDCFNRVVLDKGHEIRRLPAQMSHAVMWLRAPYRIVLSGTPTLNDLDEFMYIMKFLEPINVF